MKQAPAPVARSVLIAYSLPAFVVALPTIPVFIHLPTLYGVTLGLGLAATGYALLIARIFDTVTDPLIGWLSDRFGWKGNRRKPWIAAGAVIAGIGLLQILSPPAVVDSGYLLVWSLVLYAGWTMLAVPYMAWGAELSGGYDERTRITSWRETFALLGIVGAGAVTAVTAGLGWTETESTATIAWLAIGLGGVTVPWLLWVVPDGDLAGQRKPAKRQHTLTTVKALIANRPFLRLLSAWFLNGLANGVPAALFFLYLEFGLGAAADQRPLFVLLYFIAAIAAIPLWLKLSRLYGKHRIWCWAMILACTAFVAVPVIPSGTLIAFAIVCLITGMALGADLALPPAIQADVVDYGAFRSGRARAGLQFALWGMSTKLALAAAVGLALPGVEALGFDPASPTQAGINSLVVIYALVPVVIKVLAITVVWRFPLTPEKHGKPETPKDLTDHRLVQSLAMGLSPEWPFRVDGAPATVRVEPRLRMNTNDAVIELVLRGWGISHLLSYQIAPHIAERRLLYLLEDFEMPPLPIHVIHQEGRLVSARVRAFVDFMVERLRAEPALNGTMGSR